VDEREKRSAPVPDGELSLLLLASAITLTFGATVFALVRRSSSKRLLMLTWSSVNCPCSISSGVSFVVVVRLYHLSFSRHYFAP
jgi:hypothetical protein